MKKFLSVILFMLALGVCFSACSSKRSDMVLFQLTPSTHGVDDFLKLLGEDNAGYDQDTCYNVTPGSISKEYGFTVFKFDTSCRSFLLVENEIYPLGQSLGGLGVTSFAVADLNADDKYELYFTYSWGSGMHRSQAGYFDSASSQLIFLDFENVNRDSVLVVEENTLCIYDAACTMDSFVEIEMSAGTKLGSVRMDAGNITFVEKE